MTKKKIWVINFFAGTPDSGWGERHFFFAKKWQEMGHEVEIISSSYNHMFKNLPQEKGEFTKETHDGIPFIWVKTPRYPSESIKRFWSMLVFSWKVLKLAKQIDQKPDTILVSSMPLFPIWTGVRLKKKWKAKLIFEIRDIWPLTLILIGKKSPYHPAVLFLGYFEKLLPNAKEHIEKRAKKKVEFHHVPNGIDESLQIKEPLPVETLAKIPKDKFIVGYTGTIGLANAMNYFIDAVESLKENKELHFVVVGDGYLKNEYFEKSKSFGNITFIDKIPKNQVQAMLDEFDICFVGWHKSPLYLSGVSANKYFDYMLSGKPILSSNQRIKDPVELSGCGLLVEAENPAEIVKGILDLKNMSEAEREIMGLKGKEYVLKNHTMTNLAEKYAQLF
jgi:glycosyltransferase involved in cell wall biosynthesis